MTTMAMEPVESLYSRLAAAGRSSEIPESADAYGQLIGSWELQVLRYKAVDVSAQGIRGEVHFAWVLEGRAVQDVWIMPRCSERTVWTGETNNMYGTTLRVWDRATQAWLITWINPVTGHREQQVARRIENDIVQVGARVDGTPTRWRFTEITSDSFHWKGESLGPDGQTWKLEGEFRARRTKR
ncbi:MAG: hypothetical protein ABSF78_16825 [Candidatus Acidiferrales bacterium]